MTRLDSGLRLVRTLLGNKLQALLLLALVLASALANAAPTISGTVVLQSNGTGLSGVSFTPSGSPSGASCTSSNSTGQYSCTVPQNWTGSVTPSLSGYGFVPFGRSYSGVNTDQTAQFYSAFLTSQVFYIHPDHLNTPRAITNTANTTVWKWDNNEPFGNNVANENPSGLGVFTFNLRFPGQYFDQETNTHYNYFRDYDPSIGRYVQSDPIGLIGGINTYAYVLNNPMWYADPFGLDVNVCFYEGVGINPFGHIGFGLPGESGTQGFYPTGNPFSSPGQVKQDTQKDMQCKTIASPPDKDQCMQQCRARKQTDPGQYTLASQQCTSFVRDCLRECGLPTGNYPGPRPNPFFHGLPGKK